MRLERLKQTVVEEARILKLVASTKELSRLNYETFNPVSSRQCIYGQMTGDCFSGRAFELMKYACPVALHARFTGDRPYNLDTVTMHGAWDYTYRKIGGVVYSVERVGQYSAIEIYVCQQNAKPQVLIDFLKGDTNQILEPNML